MMPISRCLLTFIVVLIAPAQASLGEHWQAGAGKAIITPQEPMWMAGYASRDHAAEGKLTDLWAKALVLEDANHRRAVLVTLDLVGIDRELSQAICRRLSERHSLERSQMAICVSHTHTGPVVGKNLGPTHYLRMDKGQQALVDRYTRFLEDQVIAAVDQALEKLAPARLSYGSGLAVFAVNRRNNAEPQVPSLREKGELRGPVDYDVPVLAVRDEHGKLAAVAFGYACHATVLSFYQWSGDYPGFAQAALEEAHPDCVALFWAGCGADQNPLPRRTVEKAQEYGAKLAAAVEATLQGVMTPLPATLETHYREIGLPLGPIPSKEEIERDAKAGNPYVAARAKMLLEKLSVDGTISSTYPYPVQCWRLGDDVQWLFLGGEVVVDYALRLKSDLAGQHTWCAGYANDVMAYIPSRRVLHEGGYEGASSMVYYGLPSTWAPELEEIIVAEAVRQAAASR